MNTYNKINFKKLLIIVYLLTFLTGAVELIPFSIKLSASAYFKASPATTGYIFSFFMIGMLITTIINGILVKYIKLKHEIFITSIIYITCSVFIFYITNINSLIPVLFTLGICFGIIYTIPNFLIVEAFDKSTRSSKLNRSDFFFSLGTFIYPIIAGYILANNGNWQSVYLSAVIIFITIILLLFFTKLPDLKISSNNSEIIKYSTWTVNIYLVGGVIFFFVASYTGFLYWTVEYLTQNFHLKIESATFGVSLFSIFYAIGCMTSSFAIKYIKVYKYILYSAITAVIAYLLLIVSKNTFMAYFSISLLGFACSTIFSSSISLGTLLLKHPSPQLVSFYIATGSVSMIVAEVYSSYIFDRFGIIAVILTSICLMLITILIMLYIMTTSKEILKKLIS